MYQPTLIRQSTVRSDENVGSHCLSENFDLEGIGNDLFCFTVYIRVDKCDIVVAYARVSISSARRRAKKRQKICLHAMTFPNALSRSSIR